MKKIRSAASHWVAATLALGGIGMVVPAQAGNVTWTIGLSSPGVQLGVSNGGYYSNYPPAYVEPYPVYVQPYYGYTQQHYGYNAPNPVIYVRPAPVYLTPYPHAPVQWQSPGPGWRQRHHHHHHHNNNNYRSGGYDRDDRHDGRHSGYWR